MPITLTHPTAGAGGTPVVLPLPSDLIWANEFAWAKVLQTTEYAGTGALHVDTWVKQAGRPIELRGAVDYAWIQRAELQALNVWADQPGQTFTLTWNGTAFPVIWDHSPNAIAATPIVEFSDPEAADYYSLTLKFLEI